MSKSYKDVMRDTGKGLRALQKGVPNVMKGFHGMHQAANAEGVLDAKTKELLALAIGVATHCDDCIAFHTQALVKLGATRDEVLECLGVAAYMGGGPSVMYSAHAINAFDELSDATP
jgi:AhpD family alkylhydroperoxidase